MIRVQHVQDGDSDRSNTIRQLKVPETESVYKEATTEQYLSYSYILNKKQTKAV